MEEGEETCVCVCVEGGERGVCVEEECVCVFGLFSKRLCVVSLS